MFEFFRQQILITHIYGTPVRIDYRWLIFSFAIIYLTTISIPTTIVEDVFIRIGYGILTAFLFFLSILLHEAAHTSTARKTGVEIFEVLLYPFGGLAKVRQLPNNLRKEFSVIFAGMFTTLVISVAFLGLMYGFEALEAGALSTISYFLFLMNLLIFIFNLFPAYPLDGGRYLRASLWKKSYDLNEATVLASRCGQVIGLAVAVFGIFLALFRGDAFFGVWITLIGLFLLSAASEVIKETLHFDNLSAGDAMEMPVPLAPEVTISEFVERVLPLYNQKTFPVAKQRQFYGILSLDDLKKLPQKEWQTTVIEEIMRPITPDYFVETTAPINQARDLMRTNGINSLGVIDESGNLVGFLQRGRIRKRT